ncbi:hypothetical protein CASFOL_017861 [Castilleja foliolosa]|uniref:Uncharacterized protein n=1 Tax=Castilleja foliolosa TaxID=1961234 RepID=A0ABD3D840_9LAMI
MWVRIGVQRWLGELQSGAPGGGRSFRRWFLGSWQGSDDGAGGSPIRRKK